MQKNRQSRWQNWLKSCPLKISFALLFLNAGCGYRMEGSYSGDKTVTVPFVEGDVDGRLTTEIVNALVKETNYHYLPSDGDLTICVKILDDKREYIGYKYDQEEITGELINRLIADEGRRKVTVELNIFRRGAHLYGPIEITAASDYNFVNSDTLDDVSFVNKEGERQSLLTFSLGQLDAWEGANDVALNVAYSRIARKIVDGLRRL